MKVLGFDIYLVIVVLAFVFVAATIWFMTKMGKGKHASRKKSIPSAKKNRYTNNLSRETFNSEAQKKPEQYPQKTTVLSEPKTKPTVEPSAVPKENPGLQRIGTVNLAKEEKETIALPTLLQPNAAAQVAAEPVALETEITEDGSADLLDVFNEEEIEDSTISYIASNLPDVDLGVLKKLGEEVSQALLKRSGVAQRRYAHE